MRYESPLLNFESARNHEVAFRVREKKALRMNTSLKGSASLASLLLIITAALLIGTSTATLTVVSQRVIGQTIRSLQSYYASEAGIEDASYRIKNGVFYSPSYSLPVGTSQASINVTPSGNLRIVNSQGQSESNVRKLQTTLKVSTVETQFVFAVQIGNGGVEMQNTSQIIGSIYSNGNIIGTNSPTITGDAFAAGASRIEHVTIGGSARAHFITDATIGANATSTTDIISVTAGKDARADRIISSTIGKNAYYQTSISSSTVGGATFPGTPAPADLPTTQMPISDSQLGSWEGEALAGGVISSPCPYSPPDGSLLGPVKIACDLIIDGTKIITMTGTLWVEGDFDLKNSAQLKLSSSYGSKSGLVIVDKPSNRSTSSKITVQNGAQILGSGTPGSYVLVASQNNSAELDGTEAAITIKNTTNAPIYYAPHGMIEIENSANLKEATAYKLRLKNSAVVTYESGLASAQFSSGPTGSFEILSWKEVE